MTSRSSFETKVLTAFIAAALGVVVLSAATMKVAKDADDAAQRVTHTHEVLNSLAYVKADTLQIELNTQSFRITGNPAQLAERDAIIADRETMLGRIKQLTIDHARQQERWMQLRGVTDQRLAISRRVELLRKTEGIEAANAFVATVPLQETRERTYRLLREMEEEERRLLENSNAEQLHSRQIMTLAGTLLALLLSVLLAATYILIRRQLRETQASQRALADNEESLSTTLHSIGDAVLATDNEGRISRMNPVAERLTGWTFNEAQGRRVDEVFNIVNGQTRAPAIVPVATVPETGDIQDLAHHTVLIARDGSERPIADCAAPIRDNAGRMRGMVLVFRDVTVEQQAQRMVREQNELLEQRVGERTAQLLESEDHLRSVISNVPALIAYVDSQQCYIYVNEQYRARFAPERPGIAGCTVREILGDERYAIAAPLIAKVLQGQPQSYDWQPFPGIWQVINYVPRRDAQKRVVGYYVLGTDITARKTTEEKIQTLNAALEQHVHELEHVSRALRTLSAGNRAMLRASDEQGLLDSMCEAIVTAGGYDTAVVWYRVDDETRSLQPKAEHGYPAGLASLRMLKASWADNAYGRGAVGTAVRNGQTSVVRDMPNDSNYAPWRRDLHDYASALACPLRVGGEIIGALAIYDAEPDTFDTDEITLLTESADDLAFGIATLRTRAEQKKIREAMHRLTRYDALTGLPNETQFTELLTVAIETGKQLGQPFAVLQTNIERLSEINDALGFSHGDQMLKEFGARLNNVSPAPAMVARLRGDEFAILLPGSDASAAIDLVQRLETALAQPFLIADIPLDVSAKIGVTLFPEHGSTPHDLYRHMDIAMHHAKKNGVVHAIFDPAQNQDQSHRLMIAGELRRAIEGGDLSLYLQPKVEIATGRVCGAEGLVRWKHAKHGLIPPGEFIGLAEHTGLIKPLTEWVIEAALRLNQAWVQQGCALPIAVNLSARNLRDEHLLEKIRHLLATWNITSGLLEIEITESTVMEDAQFALHILHKLRDEGIPLYIDDFGTGYSSLSYLQKLPVDYIKIDQSFVRDMSIRKDSALIVRSTIDLVHDLGRQTVAEGVETRESWDQLAELGCDIAQGYFIARPMPAEEFQGWVQQFHPPVTTLSGKNQKTSG
ncbi:MAG: diguanylate cyclase/phosphodiesterase with and Chase sensor(s) [Proteobacteria bacterium]|nr:diguanylate cyclase/phosphodiesterase with and Chase sensor(s) [Pseudomonadota bacterium]